MKAIVIDDEDRARQTTISLLKKLPDTVDIVGEAASVHEGVALIRRVNPELVFLDIRMRDGTGFDLLDQMHPLDFHLVFTTAYDEFALKAFRYHAFDYLLKPLDPDLLQQTVSRLRQDQGRKGTLATQIDQLFDSLRTKSMKSLAIASQDGIDYVRLNEIVYLQASGNYTTFYLDSAKKLVVSKSIKEYEEILPPDDFFRVHQSYIVASGKVKRYLKSVNSLLMSNDYEIPISRRRRTELLQWLGDS